MTADDARVPSSEWQERDQLLLALKKRAARILAQKADQNQGYLRRGQKQDYVHTVRALQAELAARDHDYTNLHDPYRNINDFLEQELGVWELPTPDTEQEESA